MRILVVTQYFYPETFRINDIVSELVRRKHTVTVLTGLPNYPEGEVYTGYENSYKTISYYCGATVIRCKLRARKKGAINLAINYISFVLQAKKTLKRIKPDFDIIFFYELSPITSGIPAIWYGRKNSISLVMYNLDIWPESVRDSQNGSIMSKKNPIFGIAKALSFYVYHHFDLIINKCEDFGNYLSKELSIPKERMVTLPEHAEDTYLSVNETPLENGVVDYMFLGNIGKSQNCDQIVNAFARVKTNNKIRLHFVGDGSYLQSLENLVHNLNMDDQIVFHGRKTISETVGLYNLADVCLLTLSNKTDSGLTPPGKLFSYMAACRPIIASINGSAKSIISKSGCGLVCNADDINGLSKLMQMVAEDPCLIEEMGRKGRLFFLNNYTINRYVDALEKNFERIGGMK